MKRKRGGPLSSVVLTKLRAISKLYGRPPTIAEVAEFTEEPRVTWQTRARRGMIETVMISGKRHIPISALEKWIAPSGGIKVLADAEVLDIRRRVGNGASLDEIETVYHDVKRYTLKRVIAGETYKKVVE